MSKTTIYKRLKKEPFFKKRDKWESLLLDTDFDFDDNKSFLASFVNKKKGKTSIDDEIV
jgi:hypothetical protein